MFDIRNSNRQVDKLYTDLGYPLELRQEYKDDTFSHKMELDEDSRIILTHFVKTKALFREYFDTDTKEWVYEVLTKPHDL